MLFYGCGVCYVCVFWLRFEEKRLDFFFFLREGRWIMCYGGGGDDDIYDGQK